MYKPTYPIELECKGDPLTMQDIFMERVKFEENRRYRNMAPPLPAPVPAVNPMKKWSEAAKHVFSKQAFKRTISIMTP